MRAQTNASAAATPSTQALVELQRTLYDSRNATRRWMHRERLGLITNEIRAAASRHPGGRALEVGPGAGPYVGLLCELFGSVVASDVESEYLAFVRSEHGERLNLTLVEDDIAGSRLEPAGFDLVLCSEVIEHTPDPAAALRGMRELLAPGGTLVLSTPQSLSTVELVGRVAFKPGMIQLARAIYREPVLPTGHISLLSRRRLRELLSEAGLQVVSGTVSGLYIPLLAELGGDRAVRIERRIASRLRHGPLSGLLWTQHWTAKRPA